jgi:hypothetical protein
VDYIGTGNDARTNADQSETQADFRVSHESVARSEDGRLMYFEHQVQRVPGYRGPLERCSDAEARALLEEFLHFTDVLCPFDYPLPPAGLPGYLHEPYSRNEKAADLLELGMSYVRAIICNERKSMHNRWKAARAFIQKIEDEAEERGWQRRVDEEMKRINEDLASSGKATPQLVYFIGAASGPIKIGIAVSPENRLRGLQTSHHEKLILLATCDGGAKQERAYHGRFAAKRLSGEWFERCPEIEAEIARLNG